MWNNVLTYIVKYLTSFDVKWNSPTFAQRTFHICATNISQRSYFTCLKGKFRWKKHLQSQVLFSGSPCWVNKKKQLITVFLMWCPQSKEYRLLRVSKKPRRLCDWTGAKRNRRHLSIMNYNELRYAPSVRNMNSHAHISPPSHSRCASQSQIASSAPCFGRFRYAKNSRLDCFSLATTSLSR